MRLSSATNKSSVSLECLFWLLRWPQDAPLATGHPGNDSSMVHSRGCKLWPISHIWPLACFCAAMRAMNGFYIFLNCWKKSEDWYFVIHEHFMVFKVQDPEIQLRRSTTMFIYWLSMGFPAAMAKLRICDRDYRAWKVKNIYSLAFYKKSLPTLVYTLSFSRHQLIVIINSWQADPASQTDMNSQNWNP